jgi:deferrochelatase/peroxidase EfeB
VSSGRRGFLGGIGLAGLAGAVAASSRGAQAARTASLAPVAGGGIVPFFGVHQSGIATPQQRAIYWAVFDMVATTRPELAKLMADWTAAAAKLCAGVGLDDATPDPAQPGRDSDDTMGMRPERLTLTFGFGPTLFSKDGADRFGLAARRPAAFVDLPQFPGDQLVPGRTGGDLSVQACADDPQVCFHAVRQLARLADGVAKLRWVQAGFLADYAAGQTPRNLMGFKDGTINVATGEARAMDRFVWADASQGWMAGGSYQVARPIRIALEHWDRMKLGFQEQTFGRHKASGAPIGCRREFDRLDLDANDADGNPVIAENAHVRLAAPETNGGAQILRRSYSYDNGVSYVAERWPPWRQGMEYDAGLLFICYQADPRAGFIRLFEKMSRFDMMNQFTTHVGGGLFACPGGARPDRYVGEALLG